MLHKKIPAQLFAKTAAKTPVGDNPATVPSELLAALYKQHDYLGKYHVNLEIKGRDDGQGYMYGVFLVSPATDAPPQAVSGEAVPPQPDPAATIRIPVIVEARKAFPFDVMITPDGKFLPLSEPRLAATLFGMQQYEASKRSEQSGEAIDVGISNGPPDRGSPQRFSKTGSAASLPLPTREAVQGLFDKVAADESLLYALARNPAFAESMSWLEESAVSGVEKTASGEVGLGVSVALYRTGSGYAGAHVDASGSPLPEFQLSRADVGRLPLEARQRLLSDGMVSLTKTASAGLPDIPKNHASEITKTGSYAVMSQGGEASRAVVICGPLDLGSNRPMSGVLVVSRDGCSMQEKVAGVPCSTPTELPPSVEPAGEGVFVFSGACTNVVKVAHVVEANGARTYLVDDDLHGRFSLHVAKVNKLTRAGDREYLLPEKHAFFQTKTAEAGFLDDPVRVGLLSSKVSHMNEVLLMEDSDGALRFHGAGLNKEAAYTDAQALAVLAMLGDSDAGGKKKVAEAHQRKVRFIAESRASTVKTASVVVPAHFNEAAVQIRADLLKFAAALPQKNTVDAVLSLGFITPENIQNYVDGLPVFEETVSRLAELLIGVRLGLADVQEAAVGPAMTGIERAITGLKKLQLRAGAEAA